MPNRIFILILFLSGWYAVVAFASPPSGTIGTSVRNLFSDDAGNIGINISAPATAFDINGTTTIRNSLDMKNNRIINVLTPIIGLDAVNKAYVDSIVGSMNAGVKLWGEGRPGADVINTAGECTNGPIRISRSARLATWDGARAACPANWWVCSTAERGTAACGTAIGKNIVGCDTPVSTSNDFQLYTNSTVAWVSNVGGTIASDSPVTATQYWGKMAKTAGSATNTQNGYTCSMLPVWCCAQ